MTLIRMNRAAGAAASIATVLGLLGGAAQAGSIDFDGLVENQTYTEADFNAALAGSGAVFENLGGPEFFARGWNMPAPLVNPPGLAVQTWPSQSGPLRVTFDDLVSQVSMIFADGSDDIDDLTFKAFNHDGTLLGQDTNQILGAGSRTLSLPFDAIKYVEFSSVGTGVSFNDSVHSVWWDDLTWTPLSTGPGEEQDPPCLDCGDDPDTGPRPKPVPTPAAVFSGLALLGALALRRRPDRA